MTLKFRKPPTEESVQRLLSSVGYSETNFTPFLRYCSIFHRMLLSYLDLALSSAVSTAAGVTAFQGRL
ncbi:MAG: hypothetical protein JRN51_03660 [Nitrososphaerota archaeon]|nr:hypothetical protein [Nitrososphaerota archaeon]